jgi:flagellar hook-basal body complex protein FliE
MPTRPKSHRRLRTIDEVTVDDLLEAIRTKVTVLQRQWDDTRKEEHQFVGYLLNVCQQVVQRLHTAETLLRAFVEYAQTQDIQDSTFNRLVTEAINFLTSPSTNPSQAPLRERTLKNSC